jgi:hypothetical protein
MIITEIYVIIQEYIIMSAKFLIRRTYYELSTLANFHILYTWACHMLFDTIPGWVKCFCKFDKNVFCWYISSWRHRNVHANGHSYEIFLTHLVFLPTGSNRNSASADTVKRVHSFSMVTYVFYLYGLNLGSI